MPLPVNKKTFSLTNRISKSFGLAIANFAVANTMFFKIKDRVRITFNSSVISKLTTTMNVRKVSLIITQMKLTEKLTQTINTKRVSITWSIKERMSAVTAVTLKLPMIITSSALQKLTTNLTIKNIQILATPTLATFYTLGSHDAKTLGTMDTNDLGDLDYAAT